VSGRAPSAGLWVGILSGAGILTVTAVSFRLGIKARNQPIPLAVGQVRGGGGQDGNWLNAAAKRVYRLP